MKLVSKLLLSLTLSTILLVSPTLSLAQTEPQLGGEDVDLNLGQKIRFFFNDLREIFIFSEERKAEFRLEQIQDIQDEIDILVAENKPIPRKLEERRMEKQVAVENALIQIKEKQPEQTQEKSGIISKLETVYNRLKQIGELNDIRLAIQDFQKLRDNDDLTPIQKEALANQIDNKINAMNSVKENCTQRINSLELAFIDNPYQQIQEICPILKNTPLQKASDIIYGYGD